MKTKTPLSPDNLLRAQHLLSSCWIGAYRGSIEADALRSAAAIDEALSVALPEQRGPLDGVRFIFRTMATGGDVAREDLQSAVYVLHQFLTSHFRPALLTPARARVARG